MCSVCVFNGQCRHIYVVVSPLNKAGIFPAANNQSQEDN